MDAAVRKRNGIHYTPDNLADFLTRQTAAHVDCLSSDDGRIRILDPACGDGQLLDGMLDALPCPDHCVEVHGFETHLAAVLHANRRISDRRVAGCQIRCDDFLGSSDAGPRSEQFDVVIANPPYVRTQTLGGDTVRALAKRFGLTGRVDLYQAFALAMFDVLKPGGTLGLLTSNRFLTVKSGSQLRQRLIRDFDVHDVFDLGDTKLFGAAVLPVIITATKKHGRGGLAKPRFHRVYRSQTGGPETSEWNSDVLDALSDHNQIGQLQCCDGSFLIERGELSSDPDQTVWSLENSQSRQWLATVRARQFATIDQVAEVKVGIKTTADPVFIREDWSDLPADQCPESRLIRPLITHHDAGRWSVSGPTAKSVLYPYDMSLTRRTPVDLRQFPKTSAYLESHRERLAGRKYVADSGRNWFEIWVPQQPAKWAKPKIVWPDISEQPRFFLDTSGAVVNGDCYWIKLRPGVDPDWLYLILAVANSTIATQFYDTVFHNKLYSGRRRFMTQYVKEFPLPPLDSKAGSQIVQAAKRLVKQFSVAGEKRMESLVRESLGV